MSHNLEIRNGRTSFAAVLDKGQKAWHGLGQYVDKAMTAQEAIELAHLNYEVKPFDLYAADYDGPMKQVPNHVGLLRTDTMDVLGVVSKSYGIIQNSECFSFLDSLIDKEEAVYETAGALGKGERIFLTAKLPDDIVINGDKIEQYFLLTSGHGNGYGLSAMLTPVRVVCNNTLNAALRDNTNKIMIRHTKNAAENIREAARLMGLASKYSIEMSQTYEAMANKKISDQQLLDYITNVVLKGNIDKEAHKRTTEKIEQIFEFAVSHETQMTDATKGTLFGAFNSITGNIGWLKDHKNPEQRMKDTFFGNGALQTQRAFDLAVSMLN